MFLPCVSELGRVARFRRLYGINHDSGAGSKLPDELSGSRVERTPSPLEGPESDSGSSFHGAPVKVAGAENGELTRVDRQIDHDSWCAWFFRLQTTR